MTTETTSLGSTSGQQQEPSISDDQRYKHPCDDLLKTYEYIDTCIPLYSASISGDWEAANRILSKQPALVRYSITENSETALHIAASTKNIKFVEELLTMMNREDLELQNKDGNTALCFAASAGNTKLAKILVDRNKELPKIPGSGDMLPLYMAALFRHHDTVRYLYKYSEIMTGECWTDVNRGWVLLRCVEARFFDVALNIFQSRPILARNEYLLMALARTSYTSGDRDLPFFRRAKNSFFGVFGKEKENEATLFLKKILENIMEMPKNKRENLLKGTSNQKEEDENGSIDEKDKEEDKTESPDEKDKVKTYSSPVLFVAAEMGNTEFLVELIRQYPDLMWQVNDNQQTIFHIAVSHRHERLYSLLHEIGSMKDAITAHKDPDKNNMLHLVGMTSKKNGLHDASGDAFQMQRELLWFKEVEDMVPLSYKEEKNNEGKTPRELFTENHRNLVSKGKEWMKGTATQCMVVATLIATIVFGVAFSIPGGYDQNGFPIFIRKEIYIAFVITDAISLIFSSASILMFLSLLTSDYDEEDFYKSLPQKLMMGLATLFLSIMTMMVTFSLSFFVLYHSNLIWVPIVISVVASLPVILYAKLQLSLLMKVYHSLRGSNSMFKPKKRLLYNQNPKF